MHGVQVDESSSGHATVNANGNDILRAPSCVYPAPPDRDGGHMDAIPGNTSAVSFAGEHAYGSVNKNKSTGS